MEAQMPVRILSTLLLLMVVVSSATAEEIVLKDGTKIVGHMTGVTADKIEVDSAYGKMTFKRTDIVAINFPENGASPAPDASVEKGRSGSERKRRGIFTGHTLRQRRPASSALILPSGWKIDRNLAIPRRCLQGLTVPAMICAF